ncbi:MAG TPA: hypothetical protein P5267_03365 [Patescibacteria group bacterium]|nr:hypothetical protein [Patescibacteria group bacterium]
MVFPFLETNLFFKNRVTRICLSLSLFFVILSFLLLYFQIAPRVESVALRYTIYFGIDLVGSWWSVYFFPLAGLVALILNFTLAHLLFLKSNILSYFLMCSSVAFQLVLTLVSFLIIFLNR